MEVNACTCFIVNDKKEVLIERRTNRGLDPNELDLCSGHIEHNELPIQAMVRELKEELGIYESLSSNIQKIGQLFIDFKKKNRDVQYNTTVYMLPCGNIDLQEFRVQPEEVKSVEFMDYLKVFEMLRKNKMRFPYVPEIEAILEKLEKRISNPKIEIENVDEGR